LIFLALSWRVWVVLALLFLYALLRRLLKQAMDRRRTNTAPRTHAAIPTRLLGTNDRTWIVFTTPMCTTCAPLVERLRAVEPGSDVRVLDATIERGVAESLRVRTAPTAVLTDRTGVVRTQLVGADAMSHYLDGTT
jgi:hypothetical protein